MTAEQKARLASATTRGARSRSAPSPAPQTIQLTDAQIAALRQLFAMLSPPPGIAPRPPPVPLAPPVSRRPPMPDLPAAEVSSLLDQVGGKAGEIVAGTVVAGLAGGFEAGSAALGTALSSAAAAAPVAVPLAAAGIIASILVPAIASGDFFSNKIADAFNATTAEGIARARAKAKIIRSDLLQTGQKFSSQGIAGGGL